MVVDDIKRTAAKEGLDIELTPKSFRAIKRLQDAAATPLTVGQIHTLRKVVKTATGSLEPADARIANIILDKINDSLEKIDLTQLSGDSAKTNTVAKQLKIADNLWNRARKAEEIEGVFEAASNTASGLENGLRIEFNKILKSKKRSKFYTPDELDAMKGL